MNKFPLVHYIESEHIQSLGSVWNFIRPAVPDTLRELEDGFYEARWWKPIPVMDIEILKRTDKITIEGVPFEPENLVGGIAIRFRLTDL